MYDDINQSMSEHVLKCGACDYVTNDYWVINRHIDQENHADCIKLGRFKEYSKKEMQEIREGWQK